MAKFMNTSTNEYIPDSLYQLVREQFENAQMVYISESGMTYEYGFDHDSYFEQFTFADMVSFLLTH